MSEPTAPERYVLRRERLTAFMVVAMALGLVFISGIVVGKNEPGYLVPILVFLLLAVSCSLSALSLARDTGVVQGERGWIRAGIPFQDKVDKRVARLQDKLQ